MNYREIMEKELEKQLERIEDLLRRILGELVTQRERIKL